jgi:hypothetical protein
MHIVLPLPCRGLAVVGGCWALAEGDDELGCGRRWRPAIAFRWDICLQRCPLLVSTTTWPRPARGLFRVPSMIDSSEMKVLKSEDFIDEPFTSAAIARTRNVIPTQ